MLPQFQSDDKDFNLMQNAWAKQLNPVVDSPTSVPIILTGIVLINGKNTINHTLSKTLTGWIVVRKRGTGNIYDIQDTNQIPDKTLLLMASSGINIDLLVF